MLLIENVTANVNGTQQQVSIGVGISRGETHVSIYKPNKMSRITGEQLADFVLTDDQKRELKQYL